MCGSMAPGSRRRLGSYEQICVHRTRKFRETNRWVGETDSRSEHDLLRMVPRHFVTLARFWHCEPMRFFRNKYELWEVQFRCGARELYQHVVMVLAFWAPPARTSGAKPRVLVPNWPMPASGPKRQKRHTQTYPTVSIGIKASKIQT